MIYSVPSLLEKSAFCISKAKLNQDKNIIISARWARIAVSYQRKAIAAITKFVDNDFCD